MDQIAKTILRRNKTGKFIHLHFKTYSQATKIRHSGNCERIDDRIREKETHPHSLHIIIIRFLTKVLHNSMGSFNYFKQMLMEQRVIYTERHEH